MTRTKAAHRIEAHHIDARSVEAHRFQTHRTSASGIAQRHVGVRSAVVFAAIAFGLSGSACSKKIDECNALIKQLNDSSTAVQSQTTGLMTNPKEAEETLTKLASTTKGETDKIGAVELSVKELAGFSKDYQAMLNEMVTAASTMGKAAGDMQAVQESVSKDRQGWMSASNAIRIACIKAREECSKLGETLTKPPTVLGLKPDEDAQKLDEYAKAIGGVELKDEALKKAVDDTNASLKAFADTLRKVDAATKAVEKATADMKATADKEPALIKSINDFCQGNQ
jgi:chromosome segregation ATPase